MDLFRTHELFEIEVLEKLKNSKFLESLVFGGGSMLRLCYELPRYSADLDFWFIKKLDIDAYFNNLVSLLKEDYDVTDAQIKHYTLLIEIRSQVYPRRLKIEIRKELKESDSQDRIAFSKYSTKQVILKTHTLEQTMKNKIAALLDRGEIRDCFDIEFLLRKGIDLPADIGGRSDRLLKTIDGFKERDFKVKLGSILDADFREYYVTQRFSYLKEKLSAPSPETF